MQVKKYTKKFMLPKRTIVSVAISILLSACASTYPCGEPTTGVCSSVSKNYQDSFSDYTNPDDLPNEGMFHRHSSSTQRDPIPFHFTKYFQTPANGSPLLSKPTMMRVWLTPYTDNDNIYHDQSYEYILTDKGHWLYANNFKASHIFRNVSLGQEGGTHSFDDTSKKVPQNTTTNPNNLLSDFPAFNALSKHEVPLDTTTTGTTKIYAP